MEQSDLGKWLYDKACTCLARRAHSEQELVRKLGAAANRSKQLAGLDLGDLDSLIAQVLAILRERGYVDDEQFALDWVAERRRHKPRGAALLEHELRDKGIDQSIIRRVLAAGFADEGSSERDVARRLAIKKIATLVRYPRVQQDIRLKRFLLNKGFSHSIVFAVVHDVLDEK